MARHPRAWHVCALSFAPLVSHVDLAASLAALAGVPLEPDAAPDSHDVLAALLGATRQRDATTW